MGARDIVTNLITNDRSSKPLKDAGKAADETARDYDKLSVAERRLALEAEKAGVAVEKAAKASAEAQAKYGKESEQAKEAVGRLRAAELNLVEAQAKVKLGSDEAARAQERLALEAEHAAAKVEKAAAAAARAEERFGLDSEQAREATRRLRAAKLDLADAEDKVKRKALEAGLAEEVSARATKDADEKTSSFGSRMRSLGPALARHATGFSLVAAGARGLGGALTRALPVLGRVTAFAAAFGSAALTAAPIVGGFALKVGAAVVQFGHLAASMGPAAASLPGLAGGFLFAKQTISVASIGIAKGLDPIMQRLGKLSAHLQNVAERGVPALSRQFLKVNFPTVADAMNRIAKATNGVVLAVGKWVNSINGQRAVRSIVEGTAQAVEDLAPHVTKLAISFGNLIGRAGPIAFEQLSAGLGKVTDALSRFLDGISKSDVRKAWGQIDGYAGSIGSFVKRLPAWGSAIMGVGRWWKAHADQIQRVRDVLGLVAIAVGVATGGWIPALVAAVSLTISHWDQVTAVLGRVNQWFHGTSASAQNVREGIGGLREGVRELVSWFRDQLLPALERGAHAVMPAINTAVRMVTNTFHENRSIIQQVQGVFRAVGLVITEAVIPAVTFLAKVAIAYLGTEFSVLIWLLNRVVFPALKDLVGIVLDVFGAIVHGASAALGWIPGLGPKLRSAADKFDKFRDQVNNALGGIKDQHVTVGATIGFTTGKGTASAGKKVGFMAGGGMVRGPGGPRDDQVPTMLSNKEFVVNAEDTARHLPLLEAINSGRLRGYARGGLVVNASTNGLAQTMAAERKALLAAAKRLAPSINAGPVSGGVRQWAGLVAQVLEELHQPLSALGPVLSRMQRESGGNPHAINLTDSNAAAGDPSRGLMQTIGSTFAAFAGPYRGAGIYDPHANIYAGINYAIHRYGAGWIGRMTAPGGYDAGGWLMPGRHLVENRTGRPEPVFSPRQWETLRANVRQGAHRGGDIHVHAHIEATGSDIELRRRIVKEIRGAVKEGQLAKEVLPTGTR